MEYRWDWISRWATYSPDHIAVQDTNTGKKLTYQSLNEKANYLAHIIQNDWKLVVGDRIGILAENAVEYVILFAAAQKTGITLVPMNWRLSGSEVDYLIGNSSPKVVLIQDRFEEKLRSATEHYTRVDINMSWEKFCQLFHQLPKVIPDFQPAFFDENHPIFILYTSGTTGFPKGALYTHKMLLWNSLNTALRLDLNSQDITLNVMPLFHTGGWNVLLTPLLHRGGTTLFIGAFDAGKVLDILDRERISIFMAVPTMLKMMVDQSRFAQVQLERLRYIVVGGEAMPIPLIETWASKGIPIRQGYGMTEVGPNLTSLHQDDAITKKGSIGKPNFYVETRIVDANGDQAKPNESGELLIKGPMVTPGYWENTAATAKAIVNGWFHTGDMVKEDEDGFLFVVDRIKNMYISGGENVYPAEVERVIRMHPSVGEVAVLPMPHPKWGETGRAFVVLQEQMLVTEIELMGHCSKKLAKFKVPQSVIFLDELPKNGSGKIDRQALKSYS